MLPRKLKKAMGELEALAENRTEGASKSFHVAGVYFKGKLVAVGYNSYKSHPMQKLWSRNKESIFLHAEVAVIIKALRVLTQQELSKSTLLVARKGKTKKLITSKPCMGCMKLIAEIGFSSVRYTTEEGWKVLEV